VTLYLSDKMKTVTDSSRLPVVFREIERWADMIITNITSSDGTVTITNPSGPTVDLSASGGGGGVYASLTGPGETTSPGSLTQHGGFFVTDSTGTGITLASNGPVEVESTGNVLTLFGGTGAVLTSSSTFATPTNSTTVHGDSVLILDSGNSEFRLQNANINVHASIFIYGGSNPNGTINSLHAGDLCIQTGATPSLWQSTATGLSSWVQYTRP
jgi:hypothetical protein